MTIIEKFLLRLKSVLNWLMLLEKAYDYLILIKSGSLRFRAMYLLVIEQEFTGSDLSGNIKIGIILPSGTNTDLHSKFMK